MSIYSIPQEKLGEGTSIKVRVLPEIKDLSYDMAIKIILEVVENNKKGRHTTFIWPVGPRGQYEVLVRLINEYRVSFRDVHIFQMDEFLTPDMKHIPEDSPLSFTGFMKRDFLDLLDADLRPLEGQHYLPTPGKEDDIMKKIEELGGIDTCYGGLGITGHVAFNEPASTDDPITDAQFRDLPTRVLRLTPETQTINSSTMVGGAIDLMPEYAITLGMKEILSARKVHLYLPRDWHSGIVRKVLHGSVTRLTPASFLQEHPDATLTLSRDAAALPMA